MIGNGSIVGNVSGSLNKTLDVTVNRSVNPRSGHASANAGIAGSVNSVANATIGADGLGKSIGLAGSSSTDGSISKQVGLTADGSHAHSIADQVQGTAHAAVSKTLSLTKEGAGHGGGSVNGTLDAAVSKTLSITHGNGGNGAGGSIDGTLGGTVNNPWSIPLTNWGMLIVERDSNGTPINRSLGNTSPDFRLSMSHNFNWKRLTVYGLIEGNYGNRLFNEEIHWSLGDYMVRYEDQDGKSVQNAKPMGFYWRAPQPEHGSGVGGFYDVLGSNNQTVQKGT